MFYMYIDQDVVKVPKHRYTSSYLEQKPLVKKRFTCVVWNTEQNCLQDTSFPPGCAG